MVQDLYLTQRDSEWLDCQALSEAATPQQKRVAFIIGGDDVTFRRAADNFVSLGYTGITAVQGYWNPHEFCTEPLPLRFGKNGGNIFRKIKDLSHLLGSDDVLSIAIFGAQADEHGKIYLTDNLGERITSVELNELFAALPCQYTLRYIPLDNSLSGIPSVGIQSREEVRPPQVAAGYRQEIASTSLLRDFF